MSEHDEQPQPDPDVPHLEVHAGLATATGSAPEHNTTADNEDGEDEAG